MKKEKMIERFVETWGQDVWDLIKDTPTVQAHIAILESFERRGKAEDRHYELALKEFEATAMYKTLVTD